MRKNSIYYWLVVAALTMSLLIVLPEVLRMMTQKSQHPSMLNYSHVIGEIGRLDYMNKEFPLTDKHGNRYTVRETDSIFPLNNFRQLMIDGRMPDSIMGQEATIRNIAAKQVVERHNPSDGHEGRKWTGLSLLYENMPKRVGMELPGDLLSMEGDMTFKDCETLERNDAKSEQFTEAVRKSGFRFPTVAVWTNNSPRKRYDNGLFAMDSDSSLYHIMMVNGRPFVRHIELPWDFHLVDMSPFEANDKSFYGFLYSADGQLAVLSPAEDGGYEVHVFENARGDISKDKILFLGNMVSWTINVVSEETVAAYAYDRYTFKLLDTMVEQRRTTSVVEKVASAMVPIHLTTAYKQSGKERLVLEVGDALGLSWVIALLTGLVYYGVKGRKKGTRGIVYTLIICLTGFSGLIAISVVPQEIEN